MGKGYKNLKLNREKIIDSVQSFFALKSELEAKVVDIFEEINSINGQNRCIVNTNQGEFFLDVFFKKDGKTTLMSNGGDSKFLTLKEELCDYIVESCKNNENQVSSQVPWFTAKNLINEDVETVISLIKDSEYCKEELSHSISNGYPAWKFRGVQGESLTITYYIKNNDRNGKLLLQGKPELLFLESIEILTQLFDTDEIETKFNDSGFFEIQIDESIIQNDILSIMPNAFDKLPSDKLKKTVKQALIFKNFKSNFEDYTVYTFPAYRALEGHYRFILSECNIEYNGTAISIWEDSIRDANYPRILKEDNNNAVIQKFGAKSEEFKKYLTDVNRIIKDERNKYFHWEKFEPGVQLDETALIEDEEMARAIIERCLTQIEKYYKIFY
jgi:hypothetical protein